MEKQTYDEVEILYPPQKEEPMKGINLSEIKRSFIQHDKNGRYANVFYYFSILPFLLSIWALLNANFASIPTILKEKPILSPLYLSNTLLFYSLILGFIVLLLVQLAAFWQRKLKTTNRLELIYLAVGYGFGLGYLIFSHPLRSFLSSYIHNTDPFKTFNTSFEILASIKFHWLVLTLIFTCGFLGLGLVTRYFKNKQLKFAVRKIK